jgi:hypothetical protein
MIFQHDGARAHFHNQVDLFYGVMLRREYSKKYPQQEKI